MVVVVMMTFNNYVLATFKNTILLTIATVLYNRSHRGYLSLTGSLYL